jgi:glycosyltransferase involved in cell wall biosynthesis
VTAPRLSVVIPTWNRSPLIDDAIGSALMQGERGEVEVIVVDDASTDGTYERLLQRYGARITLLRNETRRGAGAARNAGVAVAAGELLAFLDSDDLWLPGKLQAELDAFTQFDGADAVITDSRTFFDETPEEETRFEYNGLLAACERRTRWMADCRWLWTNSCNGVATCSITVRRDVALRLAPRLFAEDVLSCEDWEFEMRVYHGCRAVVVPQVLSHVRRIDDASRPGRAMPGLPPTPEQERIYLRDRLAVMKRAEWLTGLPDYLGAELQRMLAETTQQLQRMGGDAEC